MVERYLNGESGKAIAESLGLHPCTVQRAVKRAGVPIRSIADQARKYHCNHDAFAGVLGEEAAYWVGFILTDGCVYPTAHGSVLQIGLSEADIEHLRKFLRFLDSDYPIRIADNSRHFANSQRLASVSIRSTKIVDDLAVFGVHPRKSLVAKAAGGIESSCDFWRGCIDGDGYVYWKKQQKSDKRFPCLGLTGSHDLLCQFATYCIETVGVSVSIRPMSQLSKIFDARSCRCDAVRIARHFYISGDVAMDRKKLRAAEFETWKSFDRWGNLVSAASSVRT